MKCWPQYLVLGSSLLGIIGSSLRNGDLPEMKPYNGIAGVAIGLLSLLVLYVGGFFAPIGWSP